MGRLLDHLERGPCWRLHAFLKACRDTSQEHVIELVGLDPEMYGDVFLLSDVPSVSNPSDEAYEPPSKICKSDSGPSTSSQSLQCSDKKSAELITLEEKDSLPDTQRCLRIQQGRLLRMFSVNPKNQ